MDKMLFIDGGNLYDYINNSGNYRCCYCIGSIVRPSCRRGICHCGIRRSDCRNSGDRIVREVDQADIQEEVSLGKPRLLLFAFVKIQNGV